MTLSLARQKHTTMQVHSLAQDKTHLFIQVMMKEKAFYGQHFLVH